MRRNDLIEKAQKRFSLTKNDAIVLVDSVLHDVEQALSAGERVELYNFGILEVVERAARTSRNPHTGEAVSVPAKKTVRFRPSSRLKKLINNEE